MARSRAPALYDSSPRFIGANSGDDTILRSSQGPAGLTVLPSREAIDWFVDRADGEHRARYSGPAPRSSGPLRHRSSRCVGGSTPKIGVGDSTIAMSSLAARWDRCRSGEDDTCWRRPALLASARQTRPGVSTRAREGGVAWDERDDYCGTSPR